MNTMIVSLTDFLRHVSKYEKLVEQGVVLTVCKRSKPIFRVVPVSADNKNENAK